MTSLARPSPPTATRSFPRWAERDDGEDPGAEHEPCRKVEGGVQAGLERGVRGVDDLLDERALARRRCPAGPCRVTARRDSARFDRVDDDRLEVGRDAKVLQPPG